MLELLGIKSFVEIFSIKLFLKSIGIAILKKAAQGIGLRKSNPIFKVITFFDALYSISSCNDLGVTAFKIGYELITQNVTEILIDKVVQDRYNIEKTSSGLYVASSKLIKEPLYIGDPREYAAFIIPTKEIPVGWIRTRRI